MPGIANLAKIMQRCTKMACLTSSRIPIIPLCVSAWIFRKASTRPAALELWFEDWHDMKQQLALVWHLHQCLHGPTRFDTFTPQEGQNESHAADAASVGVFPVSTPALKTVGYPAGTPLRVAVNTVNAGSTKINLLQWHDIPKCLKSVKGPWCGISPSFLAESAG